MTTIASPLSAGEIMISLSAIRLWRLFFSLLDRIVGVRAGTHRSKSNLIELIVFRSILSALLGTINLYLSMYFNLNLFRSLIKWVRWLACWLDEMKGRSLCIQ